MAKHRIEKVNEEVRKEISEIIRNDIKDPRVTSLVSVVAAEVTPDYKFAKVFISLFGTEEERQDALKGLKNSSGYVRKLLSERMRLRYTPQINFTLDGTIEHGAHIMKILHDIEVSSKGGNVSGDVEKTEVQSSDKNQSGDFVSDENQEEGGRE